MQALPSSLPPLRFRSQALPPLLWASRSLLAWASLRSRRFSLPSLWASSSLSRSPSPLRLQSSLSFVGRPVYAAGATPVVVSYVVLVLIAVAVVSVSAVAAFANGSRWSVKKCCRARDRALHVCLGAVAVPFFARYA
ncbi:hypothetical protein [Actinoplanes sp. M2I2]|uniref:hypothetical protein n=1 Tax=Actinoplanes sp. M2I2 TaxID=1734444 RepID=UPI00201FD428|nr:hypothetical protein [Actinoplanes sp. M2I2]